MANPSPNKTLQDPGLKMFLFFSGLLGRPVISSKGRSLGRMSDLKVSLGELFPKITSLVIKPKRKKRFWEADWSEVESLNGNKINLSPGAEDRFKLLEVNPRELLLKEELLDQQVVDTYGSKIERVNDVHLLVVNKDLHIVHVDFGIRGIFRRLGWIKIVDFLTTWFFSYHFPEKLISWKYVQPLASDPSRKSLKLNVTLRKLAELHPSDLADIIEELDQRSGSRVFKALDLQTAALTLEEMEPKAQRSLIESASAETVSDLLEEMAPDEATDLLADLPKEKKRVLMQRMEKPSREQLEELLKFKEGTAGSIMTKDFIAIQEDKSIEDAIEEFRKTTHPLETVAYLYVIDREKHLLGVITLRHLLLYDKNTPVGKLMNRHLIKVEAEDDVKKVAEIFEKYKFLVIPVVDQDNSLTGVITAQDIIQERCEL